MHEKIVLERDKMKNYAHFQSVIINLLEMWLKCAFYIKKLLLSNKIYIGKPKIYTDKSITNTLSSGRGRFIHKESYSQSMKVIFSFMYFSLDPVETTWVRMR